VSKIGEKDIREAKDDLVSRFSDAAKRGGSLPDVRSFEQFIAPVLDKIIRDPEPKKPKTPKRKQKAFEAPTAGSRSGNGVRSFGYTLGDYEIGPGGKHDVRPVNGAPDAAALRQDMPLKHRVYRDMVSELWEMPEWKSRLVKATQGLPKDKDSAMEELGKRYRAILADAVRLFGKPVPVAETRPRKIIVS
jgi:hypothetical protein